MSAARILPRLAPRFFRPSLPARPLGPRFFSSSAAAPRPSLSARLKSLSKEYGYSALGVYLGLSALDFPFCFLGVRVVGSERISAYEEVVVDVARRGYQATAEKWGAPVWKKKQAGEETEAEVEVREGRASIWTELALAYAIHKSLIFFRVPLTAAVTPKVVKVLRGWGWDIGKKGKPKITMPPAMKKARD